MQRGETRAVGAMRAALRSPPGWIFGSLLCVAALICHYTAHYWHPTGLKLVHAGPMTPGYAFALLGLCLVCGILLWHYVGRRFSSASTVNRVSWCIGLGVGAAVAIYLAFALVLAANIVVDVAFEPGNNVLALAGLLVVMLLVGIWSVLVPALPYGVAAGIAFYFIAERFDWVRGGT
jgi:hypothetical protein